MEVVESHLKRIGDLNPILNAVVTLAAESACEAARAAEGKLARAEVIGPLEGVPIGIKDVTVTAGIRTTFASHLFENFVPAEDAEVVRRLKRAGAIVLAKTNTPEFACGANTNNELFGPTRNPWNLALTPGGSSGGSAAAVATGMLPIAQGTDFGGSVRVPAAFCGIVGLRPTPGLTPNYPMALAWDPGQVHGPMARTAEDVALMLDCMVGFSALSPLSVSPPWGSALSAVKRAQDASGLRIAYVSDIAGIGVDGEIDLQCSRAARQLRDAGALVEEIEFNVGEGRDSYQAWRGMWMVGQQFNNLPHLEAFGENLRTNVKAGLELRSYDFAAAEKVRQEVFHKFRILFEKYDVLMTPTAPVPPFKVEVNFPTEINGRCLENYIDWIAPAFLVTLASLPAASVPAGKTAAGSPVGLQIVAPRFQEPLILSVAKIVQKLNPVGWPP